MERYEALLFNDICLSAVDETGFNEHVTFTLLFKSSTTVRRQQRQITLY
jgi:hypothetical protein